MAGGGRCGWFSMVTVFFTWSWLMSSYICSTVSGCLSWETQQHGSRDELILFTTKMSWSLWIHILHHIQRARVEGSGSIYHRWCTGRTFWSAGWRLRSPALLWLCFPPSYWCRASPGVKTAGLSGGSGMITDIKKTCCDLTSSVSSRPLSSYSERKTICAWLWDIRQLLY